jgi:hypothetical protein
MTKRLRKRRQEVTEAPQYAHECGIRDLYATRLAAERPNERLVRKEAGYLTAARRVDMRTIDHAGLLREWEFKIRADYRTLGQILLYVAHARRERQFERPIRGVIAAFTIPSELRIAVEVLNLSIEFVTIPPWMRAAGYIPANGVGQRINIPKIPTKGEQI